MAKLGSTLLREPLLSFALCGALIFSLYTVFAEPDRQRIVITAEIVDDLVQTQEALLGRSIGPKERQLLIAQFIDREILIREAYARGLDQRDGRVRHLLVDKMSFLINEEPPEPTAADLQALYATHASRYRTPKAVSFEHVFFESDRAAAVRLLPELQAGRAQAETAGEAFWLGRRLEHMNKTNMSVVLGTDFAEAVMALEAGVWEGPLPSARGWHLVRVEAHHQPQPLPQEQLRVRLREDWLAQRRNELYLRHMSELRARYRIQIEPQALQG